tara:strand:- start:2191 stop:2781 length:591 start_codon:yes stop_codon:yes gene_type:complete
MTDWRTNLLKALREAGMTMKDVSLAAGLNHSAISEWLGSKKKAPSIENFLAACAAIGVSPVTILGGQDGPQKVPVVGVVSGGEGWIAINDHEADALEFSAGNEDLIGLEVRGDSMDPVYRNGDFLVCQRTSGRNAHNLVNSDVVVRTATGGQFVKILKRGRQTDLFTLKSYNPRFDDITDVQIEWAAAVTWIKRGS